MNRIASVLLLICAAVVGRSEAFVTPSNTFGVAAQSTFSSPQTSNAFYQPEALQRQRKSVASVQTMGLFGLGAPEIGVILVAAAFLLGPEKLASLGKDAGKIAGELKEVPKEFQAGMAEGEAQAAAIKAKDTEPESVPAEKKQE
eukprot:CAMPEP_0119551872 /NCGR_PEP_ID=MMETSP1352-20130426/5004_1 /TAXON_ID=265584 /ORGANISM="Stauroneis constricta, Strain CCMP1120" /LENGTH=143 /DNA_ID=CAMNT_0007597993 /DNA_START=101 /DNA_END=532 /DNA_ORIENTATION=-